MLNNYESIVLRNFPDAPRHFHELSGIEHEMYQSIWRAIFHNGLKPGTKLREDTIGEAFGVSRTLVRKVLIVLAQEGMVTLPANHGAYVATPTAEDAKEVLEALRMVTHHVVLKLASDPSHITPENDQRIKEHIHLQREAETSEQIILARSLSREYHILLVFIYGNKLLSANFANLMARMTLAMAVFVKSAFVPSRVEFQERLHAAILSGSPSTAGSLVDKHYDSVANALNFYVSDAEVDLKEILLKASINPPLGKSSRK
jgi:DNA-binding GntR family transcriptional regulator